MPKGTKGDLLQVAILTLFMVSAILLIANFWFSRQRRGAFDQAQAAVDEYNKLKEDLKNPRLREALVIAQQIEEAKGRRDLHSEINGRLQAELPGVKESPKIGARRDRSGNYWVHVYKLDSGRGGAREKVTKPIDVWMGFLGRLEADRPDIHVESIAMDTDSFDITSVEKRNWRCEASVVLWEPAQQQSPADKAVK